MHGATIRISIKFDFWGFFQSLSKNLNFEIRQEYRVLPMKPCVHLWQYLAQFFSEWEMFHINVAEKFKTHNTCSVTFLPKIILFIGKVQNYCTACLATDDNVVWCMRTACWITKATVTNSKYVMLLACTRQQWLREGALMLRFYVHCLSSICVTLISCVWRLIIDTFAVIHVKEWPTLH